MKLNLATILATTLAVTVTAAPANEAVTLTTRDKVDHIGGTHANFIKLWKEDAMNRWRWQYAGKCDDYKNALKTNYGSTNNFRCLEKDGKKYFDTNMVVGVAGDPYLTRLVIPPLQNGKHTHTIIFLHGRGSNSEHFGSVFLESTDIARRLPTVKFIFPTAKKRRATVLKRTPIHQWFDNYSLEDPNVRIELQVDGLEETSRFLRTLIDDEAQLLGESDDPTLSNGYSRIVIGGLSQGCAASVICLLGGFPGQDSGQHKQLGGFVGMSGWLPLDRDITGLLGLDNENEGKNEDEDPFSRDDEKDEDTPAPVQALNHVRDILDLPSLRHEVENGFEGAVQKGDQESCGPPKPHLQTPVFLGHGSADPKVSVDLGERMTSVLSNGFGMDVTWKAYEDFGHWYKIPDEIDDMVDFLEEKVGVPSVG
ncbi:alpha/beta hydrolase [Aspergillus candidus]|uniref:Acyl-protein thioesterase 1 n=1 Tax=Aspergillus candidus TaxID=41067 RepID=A0A2I2FML6_ASPCN|nr:Alpha/Beta hydrolase protein [Aspergillus candidus]PLB41872.1 Alpha/Beta hydrolase protein [Aspergillus candidus]